MHHLSTPAARHQSGTTTAAAVIHLVLMSVAVIIALFALVVVGMLGHSVAKSSDAHNSVNGVLLFVSFVAASFCGVGIWLGVMLLRRRNWARWTLVVIYGLGALSHLANIANGRGGGGVIGLAIDAAMLILLLHPATARDCSNAAALPAPLPHPPGWYPDPHDRAPLRYWNGRAWTEHEHAGHN